jgi:aryl-alcohol dehydrogenase-like predicted oxidoreductase
VVAASVTQAYRKLTIPGATKLHRLKENLGSVTVEFTENGLKHIDEVASRLNLQGARLPEAVLKMTGL